MELTIAIGIGLWFVFTGIVSFISVAKSFENKEGDN